MPLEAFDEAYSDPPPPSEPLPPEVLAKIAIDAAALAIQLEDWSEQLNAAVKANPDKPLGMLDVGIPRLPDIAEQEILNAVISAGNTVGVAYALLLAEYEAQDSTLVSDSLVLQPQL